MDSLLASYASSEEEEDRNEGRMTEPPSRSRPDSSSSAPSLFSSLPQPRQASGEPEFPSIPNPQNPRPLKSASLGSEENESQLPNSRLKLFSSLPLPKQSQNSSQQPKRVVQIRREITLPRPRGTDVDEDEDDDEGEKEKKRKRDMELVAQNSSVRSFLSSMPAARGSTALGALPSSGSGRRMIIDTDSNDPSSSGGLAGDSQSGFVQNAEDFSNYVNHYDSVIALSAAPVSVGVMGNTDVPVGVDQGNGGYYGSYVDPSGSGYVGYDNRYANSYQTGFDQGANGGGDPSYVSYEGSGNHGSGMTHSEIKVTGKRGRNEIPAEIVEVKQDELMKNRPREDQMKLTGIAFGPSYQPVSTKGKPSKLHKRKHQIGSLYYDMKQKETELSERRARGFLTKSQTQGKYGW
ncbi:hypothetical protein SAY86_009931 [Trapa natans]|uniref:Proline-rich protein PRCC n=1 Tax=Trapa natans TaxID=22666 RepID=A0AAN7L5F2_TRANT|nr:hypothetical protein SAY86_009931 [Trapa natans]